MFIMCPHHHSILSAWTGVHSVWVFPRDDKTKKGFAMVPVRCIGSANHAGSGNCRRRFPFGYCWLLWLRYDFIDESLSETIQPMVRVPWEALLRKTMASR